MTVTAAAAAATRSAALEVVLCGVHVGPVDGRTTRSFTMPSFPVARWHGFERRHHGGVVGVGTDPADPA